MKKKKILVWEPIQHSACAFYRSKGVLEFMDADDLQFDFWQEPNRLAQHHLFGYDAVMVNRSYDPNGEMIIDWAKELGLGVITDYDDDLFNVEPDNEKAYPAFANPQHQNHVRNILSKADLVTVTTEGLKRSYARYNNNIAVIPNAFNDAIFDENSIKRSNKKVVLWRGGESHRLEINEFAPEIIRVMQKFPEWKFVMMGAPQVSYTIQRKMDSKQCAVIPAMDLIKYFYYMNNVLTPAVTIVPLRDNVFNAAKSNIAWQETTWSGGTCVLPNQYQWKDLPAHIYSDVATFGEQMEEAIVTATTKGAELFENSVCELKKNWLLSEVNKNRAEIYRSLFR